MKPIEILLNQGLNTAEGDENVAAGELVSGIGIYYKAGDSTRAHKVEGRTLFGQVTTSGFNTPTTGSGSFIFDDSNIPVYTPTFYTATPVLGIVAAVFDSGVSQMIAYAGSGIYMAALGSTGAFTVLSSGEWGLDGVLMGGIHNDDRWYVYNGADQNQVVGVPTYDASGVLVSGSIRGHGMRPPNNKYPITTAGASSGTLFVATAVDGSGYYVNRPYSIIAGYVTHAWYRTDNPGGALTYPDAFNVSEGATIGAGGYYFNGPSQWGSPVNFAGVYNGFAGGNDHTYGYTIQWLDPTAAFDSTTSGTYDDTTWAESRSYYWDGTTHDDGIHTHPGWHFILYSGFAASTAPDRRITAKVSCYRSAGGQGQGYYEAPKLIGEYSVDHGVSWQPFGQTLWTEGASIKSWTSQLILENNNKVQVRFGHLWCGKKEFQSTAKIYDVRIVDGGLADPLTTDETVGIQYDYTEKDDNTLFFGKPLESIVSNRLGTTPVILVSGLGGVTLTLPAAPQNKNTTAYNIYRTPISGVSFQDLTKVGELSLAGISGVIPAPGSTSGTITWQDDFSIPLDDVGISPYPTIRIVDEYFHRDDTPPAFVNLNYFQGSFIGVTLLQPRALYYTPPGLVESNPLCYLITAFPMPEHDFLMGTMTIGNTLVILADGGVMTMDELPIADEQGVLTSNASVRRMEGAPGCPGHRGFCSFSADGPLQGAWISKVGVHTTDGTNTIRISNDIDWDTMVGVATLDKAILTWDKERQLLVMDYDLDGDGQNDRALFFHMAAEHRKQNGRPKITGPHFRRSMGSTRGEVNGIPLTYTSHSDGNVYLEWNGNTDASNAYNVSGIVPLSVKTGKVYDNAGYAEYRVFKAVVQHSHFADNGSLIWHFGRDRTGYTDSITKTISLSGIRNTEAFIGRQQEWSQLEFSHLGSGIGSIGRIKLIANSEGGL